MEKEGPQGLYRAELEPYRVGGPTEISLGPDGTHRGAVGKEGPVGPPWGRRGPTGTL